jgi:hypothetical protein
MHDRKDWTTDGINSQEIKVELKNMSNRALKISTHLQVVLQALYIKTIAYNISNSHHFEIYMY